MLGLVLLTLLAPPDGDRRDALARYGAGVLKQSRDELLSAQSQYEAAATADPTATAPLKALIPLYLDLGRDPAAERTARKVLDLDPEDAATGLALGRMLLTAKKPIDAMTVLMKAAASPRLSDDPGAAADLFLELARAAEAANNPGAAEAALKKRVDLLIAKRLPIARSYRWTTAEVDHISAETWERLGTVRLGRRDWDGATGAFQNAHTLFADPDGANDPTAAARLDRNRAKVAAAKGDFAEAVTRQAAYLAAKPVGLAPLVEYAAYIRSAGQDSVAVFERLAAANSRSERVKWVLAAERGRADFARVAAAKEQLFGFAKSSTDPELFALIAEFLRTAGRPDDALDWIAQASSAAFGESPVSAKVKRMALVADAVAGNSALAEAVVSRAATELGSGTKRTPAVWECVGWLAERTGRADVADDAVLTAFHQSANPANDLLYSAIRVYTRRGRWDEVLAACDKSILAAGKSFPYWAHVHKALAYAEMGREADALAALVDAGKLDFQLEWKFDLRSRKVEVLTRLERYDRAVQEAEKLLAEQSRPGDVAQVRYQLATAYLGQKRFDKAEESLQAVLEYNPDDVLALNNLGYHLADDGRKLPEAETMIRRAVELNRDERARAGNPVPENGIYLDSLGWVLFRRGKLAEARAVFEQAVAFPEGAGDPVVWDHYGDVLYKLGEKEKAREAWRKAEPGYAVGHKGREGGRREELKRKLDLFP
jgi:tetratricopeptide (TPR) repeat protein